ncbi:zinc-carboxypeptidase, putative [Plasmodium ovale]|uniref:Zinc-carboxypeptidase, putative n=1 Tax=Plasmodium ovale TaxID=36330 RepID=A0A1C3KN00_PLAOA|nr:zinc-carboxypeptidase, putative [Plasmodium ovale]
MLIKNEDSSNIFQHFTINSPSAIPLFHFLSVDNNGDRVGKPSANNAQIANNHEREKRMDKTEEEKEGKKQTGERKNMDRKRSDNEEVSGAKKGIHKSNHNSIPGSGILHSGSSNDCSQSRVTGNSDYRSNDTSDLVYHEDFNLIFEDTDIHVEIPAITNCNEEERSSRFNAMYSKTFGLNEDEGDKRITFGNVPNRRENMVEENRVNTINDLKLFLNRNLAEVNWKNRDLFFKNMNTIDEVLNYNFSSICKKRFEVGTSAFCQHDNFLIHLPIRKRGSQIKFMEGINFLKDESRKKKKHTADDGNDKGKNCDKPLERDNIFSISKWDKVGMLVKPVHSYMLESGKPQKGDVEDVYVEEETSQKYPLKQEETVGASTRSMLLSPLTMYDKVENFSCAEKPGMTYKYVYPPNHKQDNGKKLRIPKLHVLFNSKFESGNLQYVMKEKNEEVYSLFLNHDIKMNEKKNQWFYFSASYIPDIYYENISSKVKTKQRCMNLFINEINKDMHMSCENIKCSLDFSDKFAVSKVKKLEKPFSVKFRIENMSKPYFLYKEGHSPLTFSECKNRFENVQWERNAYDVRYIKNSIPKHFNVKKNCMERLSYCTYTLEFSYDFTYNFDTVYFASSYPYTYSYLMHYLSCIQSYVRGKKNINYVEEKLCKTNCGFSCPVLAITNYDKYGDKFREEEKKNQKNEASNGTTCDKCVFANSEDMKESGINHLGKEKICICIERGSKEWIKTSKLGTGEQQNERDDNKREHCGKETTLVMTEEHTSFNGVNINANCSRLLNGKSFQTFDCGKVSKLNRDNTRNDTHKEKLCLYGLCNFANGMSLTESVSSVAKCRNGGEEEVSFNGGAFYRNGLRKYADGFMSEFSNLVKKDVAYSARRSITRVQKGSTLHSSPTPSLLTSHASPLLPSELLNSHELVGDRSKGGKEVVFLTARVHPGETNSSYAMHGFLSFIISDSVYANMLRDNYIFIIIPMLNIDGVVLGHNRYCSNGFDLNRQWNRPIYYLHPTIYTAKLLLKKISLSNKVVFFCDFHGHSRKYNCFLFGNPDTKMCIKGRKFSEIFPEIFSQSVPWFSIEDTKFKGENENRGIARNICGKAFKIDCSYTLEISLLGMQIKKDCSFMLNAEKGILFNSMGDEICERNNYAKKNFMNMSGNFQIWEEEKVKNMFEGNTACVGNDHPPLHKKEGVNNVENGETKHKEGATEHYYDKNKYDFFFFDENLLLMTGVSFGLCLFKFFNFVLCHGASFAGGEEGEGEKKLPLSRNSKCARSSRSACSVRSGEEESLSPNGEKKPLYLNSSEKKKMSKLQKAKLRRSSRRSANNCNVKGDHERGGEKKPICDGVQSSSCKILKGNRRNGKSFLNVKDKGSINGYIKLVKRSKVRNNSSKPGKCQDRDKKIINSLNEKDVKYATNKLISAELLMKNRHCTKKITKKKFSFSLNSTFSSCVEAARRLIKKKKAPLISVRKGDVQNNGDHSTCKLSVDDKNCDNGCTSEGSYNGNDNGSTDDSPQGYNPIGKENSVDGGGKRRVEPPPDECCSKGRLPRKHKKKSNFVRLSKTKGDTRKRLKCVIIKRRKKQTPERKVGTDILQGQHMYSTVKGRRQSQQPQKRSTVLDESRRRDGDPATDGCLIKRRKFKGRIVMVTKGGKGKCPVLRQTELVHRQKRKSNIKGMHSEGFKPASVNATTTANATTGMAV